MGNDRSSPSKASRIGRRSAIGAALVVAVAVGGHGYSTAGGAPPPAAPVIDAMVVTGRAISLHEGPHTWTVGAGTLDAEQSDTIAVSSPSFLVVVSGSLGVDGFSTGAGRWLTPFEAEVLLPGEPAAIAAGPDTASYLAIGLVANGGQVGDLVGDAFDVAAGTYDVDLYGDVVRSGELAHLPASPTGPTVVAVAAASVEVDGRLLTEGDAVAADGSSIAINAGDDDAVVLAAVLSARFGDTAPTDAPATTAGEPPTATGDPPATLVPDPPSSTPPTTAPPPSTAPPSPTTTPSGPTTTDSIVAVTVDPDPPLGTVPTPPVAVTVDPNPPLGCIDEGIDSDLDELSDCEELLFGSDPHDFDTDNDFLDDHREFVLGCDPRDIDTDGDTVRDGEDGPQPSDSYNHGSWCADPSLPDHP